jgi:hypothetical protein
MEIEATSKGFEAEAGLIASRGTRWQRLSVWRAALQNEGERRARF